MSAVSETEKLFDRFKLLLTAQRNVSKSSVRNYLNTLQCFRRWSEKRGVSVEEWSAELVTKYLVTLQHPSTRHHYSRTIKYFMKTLGYKDAKDIRVPPRPKLKLPDILTEKQVLKLARACDNVRDRALILLTFESTRRNHEVVGVRLRDIKFDEYGAVVTFHSNKSEDASIRCTLSASALQQLVELHPNRDNPDSPLFLGTRFNQPVSTALFRWILAKASKKAGIYVTKEGKRKAVWPHLLRHSGIAAMKLATDENGGLIYSEDDIMNCSGHRSRRMLDRYGKITMTLTNNRRLVAAGLRKEEHEKKVSVKSCLRCGYVNGPLARFCGRCQMPLDKKEMTKRDQIHGRVDSLMNIAGGVEFFEEITQNAFRVLSKMQKEQKKVA